jgi:hypothetical protein
MGNEQGKGRNVIFSSQQQFLTNNLQLSFSRLAADLGHAKRVKRLWLDPITDLAWPNA